MNSRRLAAAATLTGAAALAAALTITPAPRAQAQAARPPAPNAASKALYAEKCSACHNLYDPQEKAYSRAEWQRTVDKMLNKYKASDSITPPEAAQIVDYLATFSPKPGAGGRKPANPWDTSRDDLWTVSPSASRVFNFEAPGALSAFSPLAGGTPGPAPAWKLAPLESGPDGTSVKVIPAKPDPGHFALLVDRKDQGRNLDVRVRFQILGGAASPAVGIAFGFASPKAYSVLVYNQKHADLTLLQIVEPNHPMLQQTPLDLTPPGAALTAQPPAGGRAAGGGWHTLRLQVKDGWIRGWVDQTKRINVEDAAYQGGKVGLWSQGDTSAVFDDWTVDFYDAPADVRPGV